jgi:hypothetical protein
MGRRKLTDLRYSVDGSDKSYPDTGSAISLSITLACRAMRAGLETTVYVRDTITGDIVGFSESVEKDGRMQVLTRGRSRS